MNKNQSFKLLMDIISTTKGSFLKAEHMTRLYQYFDADLGETRLFSAKVLNHYTEYNIDILVNSNELIGRLFNKLKDPFESARYEESQLLSTLIVKKSDILNIDHLKELLQIINREKDAEFWSTTLFVIATLGKLKVEHSILKKFSSSLVDLIHHKTPNIGLVQLFKTLTIIVKDSSQFLTFTIDNKIEGKIVSLLKSENVPISELSTFSSTLFELKSSFLKEQFLDILDLFNHVSNTIAEFSENLTEMIFEHNPQYTNKKILGKVFDHLGSKDSQERTLIQKLLNKVFSTQITNPQNNLQWTCLDNFNDGLDSKYEDTIQFTLSILEKMMASDLRKLAESKKIQKSLLKISQSKSESAPVAKNLIIQLSQP